MTDETGMKKKKKLPIGVSDFKKIIEGNYCYIDKTLFIKEIEERGDSIILLPRPRRFGKTLNLSMLKYFYECSPAQPSAATGTGVPGHDNKKLFESLAIMDAGDEYLEKIGRHPVIFLSFKGVKVLDWKTCYSKIKQLIQKEYARHYYLLECNQLKPFEKEYFKSIIDLKGETADFENSLENLLIFLDRYYGKRAVILIDEYDAPVHGGFTYGYYDEVINFMRNFLTGGLKDTDQYLEKSVLTGIMRIAKESIFSGLNNPGVYTLLSNAFNDKFGFTETELEALLREFEVFDTYDGVKKWYNGYRFGETIIYNPWSIINFLAEDAAKFKPYWINTSDNAIIDSLLTSGGKELKEDLEILIRGESIEKVIDENIVLKDVAIDDDSLWSFLLMGGYLKQTALNPGEDFYYSLAIPNEEVKTTYKKIIKRYFTTKIENKKMEIMLKALVEGEIDIFEEIFSDFVISAMSVFDMGGEPEKVYHAFVVGLLLWLSPGYQIKSNRESGYGRYDIMIIPKDISKLGFVIEFKKTRKKETPKAAIKSALKQIEEKKYETELIERGINNIKKLAIVFSGKDVYIKEAGTQ